MPVAVVEIDVARDVLHEREEPVVVVSFTAAEFLAGQDIRDGDIGLVEADLSGVSDDDPAVVQWIVRLGQASEGALRWGGGSRGWPCSGSHAGDGC